MAYYAKRLALFDLKVDIVQSKEALADLNIRACSYPGIGILLAAFARPPCLKITPKRTASNRAKAVFLGHVLDFYRKFFHIYLTQYP